MWISVTPQLVWRLLYLMSCQKQFWVQSHWITVLSNNSAMSNQKRCYKGVAVKYNLCVSLFAGHSRHLSHSRMGSGEICLWDQAIHCTLVQRTQAHQRPISVLSTEGQRIVSGSQDFTLKVWHQKLVPLYLEKNIKFLQPFILYIYNNCVV